MSSVAPDTLALQRLYHWGAGSTQSRNPDPAHGRGVVQDFTWGQVADQVRRMAAHLQSWAGSPARGCDPVQELRLVADD